MLSWHICILWVGMVQLCGSIVRRRRERGELSVSRKAALRGETCDQNVQICEESIWAMSFVNNVFFISVIIVPLSILAYFCSLSLHAESARAVLAFWTFWTFWGVGFFLRKRALPRKEKLKDRSEGAKTTTSPRATNRPLTKSWSYSKNGFLGRCLLFAKT